VTGADLARLVERTEAAAYADLFRAAPASLGLTVRESGGVTMLVAPQADLLLFNRAIGVGLDAPATGDLVRAIADGYRAAGVRNFGIQVSPAAEPATLYEWLGACDLHRRDDWTKVYRPCDPPPDLATDLAIEPADSRLADRFGAVACAAFGLPSAFQPFVAGTVGRPGWRHYIAWDGADAVGVAALYVRGQVGWLGVAATLPAQRRRGGQGALMARRLRDGLDLGCRWFVTETGKDRPDRPNPSFHNMVRAGFRVAYDRPNFMPSPSSR
jgi:hypothetical protein